MNAEWTDGSEQKKGNKKGKKKNTEEKPQRVRSVLRQERQFGLRRHIRLLKKKIRRWTRRPEKIYRVECIEHTEAGDKTTTITRHRKFNVSGLEKELTFSLAKLVG